MKKELLEYLVRQCVREVVRQSTVNEGLFNSTHGRPGPILGRGFVKEEEEDKKDDGETKGAAAPPEDGQGTADQPEIPKSDDGDSEQEPSEPETPEIPPQPSAPEVKGIVFVNPRDKGKLDAVKLQPGNDAAIERALYQHAARVGGPKVKVSMGAAREVKAALQNPSSPLYLYLGKYDPESEEIFLMADKSLPVAKDNSIGAENFGQQATDVAPGNFDPNVASATDFATRMSRGGATPVTGIDENLKKLIRKMVNEILGG